MSERFTLANLNHLGLFLWILLAKGDVCPECGYATRYTSKRWARCKKCDTRVQRRTEEQVEALLDEARTQAEGEGE